MYVEGRGEISWSSLTQDTKMGSCVFQCAIPHKWKAQWQVGPVSVFCAGMSVMSCVYNMTFLCGSTFVKVPLLQAGTVTIWAPMFENDVQEKQTNPKVVKKLPVTTVPGSGAFFILIAGLNVSDLSILSENDKNYMFNTMYVKILS